MKADPELEPKVFLVNVAGGATATGLCTDCCWCWRPGLACGLYTGPGRGPDFFWAILGPPPKRLAMLSSRESGSADLAPSALCSAGNKSTGRLPACEVTASGRTEATSNNITESRVLVDMVSHSLLMSRLTRRVSSDQLSILRHSSHQFHFPQPADCWANTRTFSSHSHRDREESSHTSRGWTKLSGGIWNNSDGFVPQVITRTLVENRSVTWQIETELPDRPHSLGCEVSLQTE